MRSQPASLPLVALLAFALTSALVVPLLSWARRTGAGQHVRDDGPRAHLAKQGTPTLGGLALVPGLILSAMAFAWGDATLILLCSLALLFSLWGVLDDYSKIAFTRPLGIKARHKLAAQALFSLLFLLAANQRGALPPVQLGLHHPWSPPLWLYLLLGVLYVTGFSNAANLTDGLDGLAGGVVAIASAALGALCAVQGKNALAAFCFAMTGACLGFQLFNVHPARVFMGDTGSLALGAGLAGAAILAGLPVYLLLAAIVLPVEAGSVAAQVISYQTTRKRILKMSPLHHHFELSGFAEPVVVRGFWLTTFASVLIAGVLW